MNRDQEKNKINFTVKLLLKLSQREGEVLVLVAEGKKNREIAEKLYLSERTVETHLYNIRKKLGLSGRGILQKVSKRISE